MNIIKRIAESDNSKRIKENEAKLMMAMLGPMLLIVAVVSVVTNLIYQQILEQKSAIYGSGATFLTYFNDWRFYIHSAVIIREGYLLITKRLLEICTDAESRKYKIFDLFLMDIIRQNQDTIKYTS